MIPQALRDQRQWANWHGDKVIRDSRTGRNGSSTNPQTWTSFEEAYRADPTRLVFAFQAENGLVGLDVDGRTDSDLMARFPNVYWERSLSGNGLHGIGYGSLPTEKSGAHPADIGAFQHSRYFVMTGDTIPGYETLGAFGDELQTWYRESFPEPKPGHAAPPMLTLEDQDIVERIRAEKGGGGIGMTLLAGDNAGYPGYSNARFALAEKCCFYSDDAEQVARIVLAAGLFKAADPERDHERKARLDAGKAVATYTGPRYDPDYRREPRLITPPPAAADPDLEGKSADQLRAIIRQQTAIIDAEHAARVAAEERANTLAIERSGILYILRNGDLGADRLTGFAIALDLHARIANGEQPTPDGFKAPAKRYAEMTGQSESTVAKHMRQLSKHPKTGEGKDLIPKRVVKETTDRQIEGETIDNASGEIRTERETVRGLRDVNYIDVPGGKVINLIDRLRSYQRPEGEAGHGGKRDARPACAHHPDAGTYTVKHEHIECAACHAILKKDEPKSTYHPVEDPADLGDESTGVILLPVKKSVVNLLSGSKMTPEPGDPLAANATGSIMQPDPLESHDHGGPILTRGRAGWPPESTGPPSAPLPSPALSSIRPSPTLDEQLTAGGWN
jgi:hypothetical protein